MKENDFLSGKRQNSTAWVLGAFTLTHKSDLSETVICNDDCDNCPLYKKGCAGRCTRWDDLICHNCPCLASKYAKHDELKTVDSETFKSKAMDPKLIPLIEARKSLKDGEIIPKDLQ